MADDETVDQQQPEDDDQAQPNGIWCAAYLIPLPDQPGQPADQDDAQDVAAEAAQGDQSGPGDQSEEAGWPPEDVVDRTPALAKQDRLNQVGRSFGSFAAGPIASSRVADWRPRR